MKLLELVWDRSLTVFENLAMWALAIVSLLFLWAFTVLVFILGE